MKIIYMIGPAGAGKSTFTEGKYADLPKVSRDILRAELGFCKLGEKVVCTPIQEEAVSVLANEYYTKYIREGKDFVIDDTNINQKYLKASIENMRDIAKCAHRNISLIAEVLHTPAEVCYERRKGDGLSYELIKKMCSQRDGINFKSGFFAESFDEINHH